MEKVLKKVALVAHDNMKADLAEWVAWNAQILTTHALVCTGTTGKMVEKTIVNYHIDDKHKTGDFNRPLENLDITLLKSGPLGGDQQLGAMIVENKISALIFFWDPMSAQPHDVDVKALLRLAALYNVPTAMNRASADFIISSPLFIEEGYSPEVKDYKSYIERTIK